MKILWKVSSHKFAVTCPRLLPLFEMLLLPCLSLSGLQPSTQMLALLLQPAAHIKHECMHIKLPRLVRAQCELNSVDERDIKVRKWFSDRTQCTLMKTSRTCPGFFFNLQSLNCINTLSLYLCIIFQWNHQNHKDMQYISDVQLERRGSGLSATDMEINHPCVGMFVFTAFVNNNKIKF